ncbi:GNAT family N-acetyltransferase [Polaribacter marinivivus]|uniref:GNAT family N-acetyltransferase n=1 Tax=Polaribacter marinivivus TaxID=1524260 RepID=A0ABV8R705_9FLAO
MNTIVIRTNSENKDFVNLVKQLDAYLKITDGEEHDFYNQFNNIDVLQHVVVLFENDVAVGCGAIKKFDNASMEIKRMFVKGDKRGKGYAQKIIEELEVWSKELEYKRCVLETGKRQKEAVRFYHKCNYNVIPNYGQYIGMENSVCFEKQL